MPRLLSLGVFLALNSLAAGATAQDLAAGAALFDQGVEALGRGDYATACPALAESQRLDPHAGTQFALAECYAKSGKVATAVATYQDYLALLPQLAKAQQDRHRERMTIATQAIAKLTPRVPTLLLRLPSDGGNIRRVSRDGVELKGAALGLALPVDPGQHTVLVEYEPSGSKSYPVTLTLGDKKELPLEARTAPEASEPGTTTPLATARHVGTHASSTTPDAANTHTSEPLREPGASPAGRDFTWPIVFGSVGLVGVAVGTGAGLWTLSKKSKIDAACPNEGCSKDGLDDVDSARRLAWTSNLAFGVGAAGLITAAVLYLSSPTETQKAARGWTVAAAGFPGSVQASLGHNF